MNGPNQERPVDAALLGRLLDELGPALALYAAQWTNAADDCVQEALVELARQATVPENLQAWLYRVVKHRALNAARSSRRRREREQRAAGQRAGSSSTPIGVEHRSARWDAMEVAEALDRLQSNDREIVVMRIWGGLNFEEIAAALSTSTSTAHRRYQRALETLQQILEPPCPSSNHTTTSSSRPS